MRCEEFRERLDAEPAAEFPGRLEHAAECAECARYAARAAVFERRLAAALAVDVPSFDIALPEAESPADVVPLRTRGKTSGSRPWVVPAWIGAAAVLMLGVALVLRVGSPVDGGLPPQALAAEVLAHMDHEAFSRVVTSVPVGQQELARVLRPAVSRLDSGSVGLVTYAHTCPIAGHEVPHLVVQGAEGPVTLLLMPEQPVSSPVTLEGNGFHGVILPVGDGSIAVVGEHGNSVDDVTRSIAGAVDWSI